MLGEKEFGSFLSREAILRDLRKYRVEGGVSAGFLAYFAPIVEPFAERCDAEQMNRYLSALLKIFGEEGVKPLHEQFVQMVAGIFYGADRQALEAVGVLFDLTPWDWQYAVEWDLEVCARLGINDQWFGTDHWLKLCYFYAKNLKELSVQNPWVLVSLLKAARLEEVYATERVPPPNPTFFRTYLKAHAQEVKSQMERVRDNPQLLPDLGEIWTVAYAYGQELLQDL